MINQTCTLLLDAYRELNARKLFWLVLILSTAIAAAFAAVGINKDGLTIFVWSIDFPGLSTDTMAPATFYKLLFSQLGFKLWLTWAASILALISTAGMIPDFVRSGAIEIALSKPIGRARLFCTKYLAGLLFVALQVACFSLAAFLVIGVRGHVWVPTVFLAIPLVVVFFSYLYCVCALVGLLTRSTLTAVLVTVLFWFLCFLVSSAERTFLLFDISTQRQVQELHARIQTRSVTLDDLRARPDLSPAESARAQRIEDQIQRDRDQLQRLEPSSRRLHNLHALSFAVKTLLPKTGETMDLFERYLVDWGELEPLRQQSLQAQDNDAPFGSPEDAYRPEQIIRSRSPLWVVGSSLAFEAAVLALACIIFVRRDF